MLFHNRPARAAMGSVIAKGGVQLSNDESLIRAEWKLGTLHFGGCVSLYGLTGGSAGESESGVDSPFLGGGWVGGVGWFGSVSILHLAKPALPSLYFLFPTGSRPAVSLAGWLMGQSDGRSDGLSESYQRLNGSWLYCQLAFWQTFSHILFLPIFPSSMFGWKGKVIVGK